MWTSIPFLVAHSQAQATIRVSYCLDPYQHQCSVSPDLGQTVCKGYQQTKSPLVRKVLRVKWVLKLKERAKDSKEFLLVK